ncbi:hypothetical protein H096_26833 [Pseudomonas sp. FH1]|nr:hypothetical protein H096_26833 [Pseudomonas sp. FH1]
MKAPQLKAIIVAAAQCVRINPVVMFLKLPSRLNARRSKARVALDNVTLYISNVMYEKSLSAFQ